MERPLADVVRSPKLVRRGRAAPWARARRHRRRILAGVVLSGLIVGGGVLVNSPLFELNGIEIRGTRLLTRAQVLEASGLRTGMKVLSLKPDVVAADLERLALVSNAEVTRLYPSRVRIVVEERSPIAIVDTDWGPWLVDAGGELIGRPPPAPIGVPRVRIVAPPRTDAVREALLLLTALPEQERRGLTQIEAPDAAGLAVVIRGVRVIFGSPDQIAAKLRAVDLVLDDARARGKRVTAIDVRSPQRPAARLV